MAMAPNLTLNPQFPHLKTLNFFNFPILNCSFPLSHRTKSSISSKCLINPSPSPRHKKTSTFFPRNIAATVLLGSLIFAGAFNLNLKSRPVLADPIHETREKFEEEDEEIMCEKLVEQNPIDVEALKTAVNLKIKKGKTKDAVRYVERLIQLQPNEMEWRLLQGLCYEMMGDFTTAKRLFKDILKQKPLLLRALHGLAMAMHKNKEGPAIFVMLERALHLARREKRVNEERNIRILMAQMHIIKGELEVALEKLQGLIDENPRDFRPYLCQGIVYSLLGRKEEADERFEIYRQLVPGEFPQRGFLDDVVTAARTESRQQLQKQMQA